MCRHLPAGEVYITPIPILSDGSDKLCFIQRDKHAAYAKYAATLVQMPEGTLIYIILIYSKR